MWTRRTPLVEDGLDTALGDGGLGELLIVVDEKLRQQLTAAALQRRILSEVHQARARSSSLEKSGCVVAVRPNDGGVCRLVSDVVNRSAERLQWIYD